MIFRNSTSGTSSEPNPFCVKVQNMNCTNHYCKALTFSFLCVGKFSVQFLALIKKFFIETRKKTTWTEITRAVRRIFSTPLTHAYELPSPRHCASSPGQRVLAMEVHQSRSWKLASCDYKSEISSRESENLYTFLWTERVDLTLLLFLNR